MRVGFGPIVLAVLLVCPIMSAAQGKLAAVREDVRGDNESDTEKKDKKEPRDDCHTHDDDSRPFFLLDFSSFFHDPCYWRSFPAHPYPLGLDGYMQLDPVPVEQITGRAGDLLDLKPWALRIAIENGNNFDDINRFGGSILGETQFGLGLYTSWDYLCEDLGRGYYDDLVLGNITLTWRFVDSPSFMARWGIGAWIVTDGCGCWSDSGVNVHLSADYFPARPWVISGLIEGGSLGDTSIVHTRLTAGWLWKGLELYGGYDFLQIGDTNLHTPMIGVRAWF